MIENQLLYIILGFLALITILLLWIVSLEMRLKKIFQGRKASSLENIFTELALEVDKLMKKSDQTENSLRTINHKLRQTLSKCHTIRFNPFRDQGSNQSFATCLLNEEGDGVIVSSLYSREKVSVYAKPIKNYQSTYELSAEEKRALSEARES